MADEQRLESGALAGLVPPAAAASAAGTAINANGATSAARRCDMRRFKSFGIDPRATINFVHGTARQKMSVVTTFIIVQRFKCVTCSAGSSRVMPNH